MSPNTTPSAPISSANCAGDRVGTTPVSTAIPTVPPLHASGTERVWATVASLSMRGVTFGSSLRSWWAFPANLDVFLTPRKDFRSPEDVFEDQTGAVFDGVKRVFVGRPLHSDRMEGTLLPKRVALAVFCSDPISSVAYATEQILLVLAAGGLAALATAPW